MTDTQGWDIEAQFVQCLVRSKHLFGNYALSLESLNQWFEISKLDIPIFPDWSQAFENLKVLPSRNLDGLIDGLFNLEKFNPNEFRRGSTFIDFMEDDKEPTLYSALWDKYEIKQLIVSSRVAEANDYLINLSIYDDCGDGEIVVNYGTVKDNVVKLEKRIVVAQWSF